MEADLQAFIRSMPLPDSPTRGQTLTEQQARGQVVFAKAECNTCHLGATLTNNEFYDVGTKVTAGNVVDTLPKGLNTPSLLGVARSAPYLHDGSATTLQVRILVGKEKDLHGKTSALTADEVTDLVAYLKTL
jgi:cytochrome c peroxidase